MPTIRKALPEDVDILTPLVDSYRQFYQQTSDTDGAHRFLVQRFDRGDAYLLIALDDANQAIGFVQLYPVPSTTSLSVRWILNDLFVTPEARRGGIGSALLQAARDLAAEHGVPQLMLRTQIENTAAQSRYQALGWQRDNAFYTYLLSV